MLPLLVVEGLEEFKGSFDRLCLQAGTSAIAAMLSVCRATSNLWKWDRDFVVARLAWRPDHRRAPQIIV